MMVGPSICDKVVPMGDITTLNIGQRVQYNGYRGTLMYVGEVPPTKGVWLGIDWDDPSRGKHDGTHEGHKYFKTRHATSGSFVRSGKLNFGQSCVTAIHNRYGELKNAGIDEDNLALVQKVINARFLEVVGLDKVNKIQSQFANLKRVILDNYAVNGAGSPMELHNMCPSIEELDLSQNLLNSWAAVAEITAQLPHLRLLNVSENLLTLPSQLEELQEAFRSVEHIIAGHLEYTWTEMLTCFKIWPHINRLQVPHNHFTTLEPPPSHVLNWLIFLDLNGNPIEDWTEINKLGKLPCLEVLNVSNNGLTNIHFPAEQADPKTELFPALKELCITENKLENWQSMCELDKLQRLENLKTVDNPLMQLENYATCRQLIIARIGNLKKLNGELVTAEERKGAEYDYLKRHGQAWLQLIKSSDKGELQDFVSVHPRYPHLIEKYGAPEEGEMKIVPTTLKSKMICVELFSQDHASKSYKKMLPRGMLVQKLVGLVQKMFDTGNEFPKLAYINSKNPGVEIPLENEFKELQFYAVEDGDRISVRW